MKTVFIYALKDPTTDEIRYIGKTIDLGSRLKTHLKSSKHGATHRACWIRSLVNQGTLPILESIDEVPEIEWPMWEVAYIQFFRDEGCNLVNSSPGGEGVTFTTEVRLKMSAAMVGNTRWLGKNLSESHRAAISAAKLGKKLKPRQRIYYGA